MKKFDKTVESLTERLSPGLFNAINKQLKVKKICSSCDFMIPKYKGRYPNFCPMCADPLTDKDKELAVDEEEVSVKEKNDE